VHYPVINRDVRECIQEVPVEPSFRPKGQPLGPDQAYYDLGVTYVLARDKRAALEQHQKLVGMNSVLAKELFQKITEMK
jgi:hypothetical protein